MRKLLAFFALILVYCDCFCANSLKKFLDSAVLCEDRKHCRKVEKVFASSFLIPQSVDGKSVFRDCIHSISGHSGGRKLLTRLDVLFKFYRAVAGQEVKFVVTFSSDPSSFSGKFSRTMDETTRLPDSHFSFNGNRIEQDLGDFIFVRINLNLIDGTLYHEQLGLCTIVPAISKVREYNGKLICSVCDCADPYWMLVAHEMIHLEHFLTQEIAKYCGNQLGLKSVELIDEYVNSHKNEIERKLQGLLPQKSDIADYSSVGLLKKMYACAERCSLDTLREMCNELYDVKRYSGNIEITPQKALVYVDSSAEEGAVLFVLPELNSRKNRVSHLWNNLEERETVIGPDISELTLRLEADLPIRYVYQSKGKNFFEDFSTMLQIVQVARKEGLLQQDVVEFINKKGCDPHFDTRKFRPIIDDEFLPGNLVDFFGLELQSEDREQLLQLTSEQARGKSGPQKMPKRLLCLRLSTIVSNFNEDCLDIGSIFENNSIKPEIKRILKGNEEVVSEVEKHLKENAPNTNKTIVKKLIDLLDDYLQSLGQSKKKH